MSGRARLLNQNAKRVTEMLGMNQRLKLPELRAVPTQLPSALHRLACDGGEKHPLAGPVSREQPGLPPRELQSAEVHVRRQILLARFREKIE